MRRVIPDNKVSYDYEKVLNEFVSALNKGLLMFLHDNIKMFLERELYLDSNTRISVILRDELEFGEEVQNDFKQSDDTDIRPRKGSLNLINTIY